MPDSQPEPLTFDYIYRYYLDEVKVPLAVIKTLTNGMGEPAIFSMELRSATTHLARAFKKETGSESGDDESGDDGRERSVQRDLKGALGHLQRCQLDAYKWLCNYQAMLIQRTLEESCRRFPLSDVCDGRYLRGLHTRLALADALFESAKVANARDGQDTAPYYKLAAEAYEALLDAIQNPDEETLEAIEDAIAKRMKDWKGFYTTVITEVIKAAAGEVVGAR